MTYGEHTLCDSSGRVLFKLFHSSVKPCKRTYRNHHHTAFEISTFLSGSGIYTVGDRKYPFSRGSVFVFSSDEEHCITDIYETEEMNLINIQFEPRFIWGDQSGISKTSLLKIFFDRSNSFSHLLPERNPATEQIRRLIRETEAEFEGHQEEYPIMIRMKLFTMLIIMMRSYGFTLSGDKYLPENDNLSYLENAMEYIDDNFTHNLSLESLAAVAKMSRGRFCMLFKKYNGITPWEYITIKRIERSIELLKTTKHTKLDIATMCGFNNAANFYRAFKKITSKTPSDYSR